MTGGEWQAGCYVDGWWGHYSVSRALLVALELGWSPDDHGLVRDVAVWEAGNAGGRLTDEYDRPPGISEGALVSEFLSDCLDEAEAWLNEQPKTPEGHWWGHHPAGGVGWGCWEMEVEA